jgi:hypothetical protein
MVRPSSAWIQNPTLTHIFPVPQHVRLGQHRLLAPGPAAPGRVRARGREAGLGGGRPPEQDALHPPRAQGAFPVLVVSTGLHS